MDAIMQSGGAEPEPERGEQRRIRSFVTLHLTRFRQNKIFSLIKLVADIQSCSIEL